MHQALRRLETELNESEADPTMAALDLPYPTTVGIVRGGVWASNVMEQLTAEIRVGVTVHETIAQAEERFERALREAVSGDPWFDAHPLRIERTGAAFGSSRIDPAHPLVTTLRAAAADVTGATPPTIGVPYGCDMALWIREGKAATIVFGPGDVRHAHAVDERVSLQQAAAVGRVLADAARRILH